MKKISIVIPTYNRASLLGRTIQSVLDQTYKEIEIIIVDDNSTDNSEELVKTYQDKQIIYLRNNYNFGAAESRNIGIDHCSGDYIAFLDSDDEWHTQKLEKQIKLIKQHKNISDFLCFTQINVTYHKKSITPVKEREENQPLVEYFFINEEFIVTSAMLFPRETIEKLKFKKDIKLFQDIDLCLRASRLPCKFLFVKEPLCTWNCDNRKDRITYNNHDGYNRFCWLEINYEFFTEKSIKAYLHSFVLQKIHTLKQKKKVQEKLVQWIHEKRIHMNDAFDIIKKLNYK